MREEWTEARIDELGNGLRPVLKAGPFGSSVTKATYQASGYKVYGQQEVVAKDLNAEAYFISETTFSRHKSCAVKPGDLLMTMMGTIGRVYRVPEGAPEGIINPRLVRLAFDTSRMLPEYAEVALEQPPLQQLLDRRSHGGTMQGLNLEALASIRLPLPPLPEQRKIADILRTWDTAIQKIEQLIAAKERHYSHELSRLFSESGASPRKCRLGDISCVPQKLPEAPKPDDIYVLVRLYCKGIEKNERQKRAPTKNGRPILRRNAGELLVGRQNIHNGGFGIVPQDLDGSLASNAITSLSFHPSKACTEYVFFYLSRPSFYKKLERVMGGTGQKEISESQLLAISIPIPDIRAQAAIVRYLNTLREEIDVLGQSVAALKTQKRGLMQKLLTGQWRVPIPQETEVPTDA